MSERSILSYSNKGSLNSDSTDDQKKLIKYREKINLLHFEAGWGKNRIVQKLGMSKHTVIRWTQSPEQDFTCDKRGWPKGKRRKWSKATEASVCALHKSLVEDPEEFFYGTTAIVH